MRVQVAVPRHLGDAVLALPALRRLARVADVLIRADGGAARLLAGQGPWSIAADRRSTWEPLPTLLLSGSTRVALTALAARARIRVGRATDGRGLLLTHRVAPPPQPLPRTTPAGRRLPALVTDEHQADAWLRAAARFADVLGLTLVAQQDDDRLELVADDHAVAARWLAHAGDPTVLLHPWAAGMVTKRWPVERWVELGERLRAGGQGIAVTGGPDAEDARTARLLAGRLGFPVAAGDGTLSPSVWAAAARRVERVVLPDTGMAHVAVAAGAGAVVVFGSTDPARHAPRGTGRARLLHRADLDCGPCYRARCTGPVPYACLSWSAERVAREVTA